MKRFFAALTLTALVGCTRSLVVDMNQGDTFSYGYAPWENGRVEEAKARVGYWLYEGPKHYNTNQVLRLELRYYLGETNLIKKATYWRWGTAEKEAREIEP